MVQRQETVVGAGGRGRRGEGEGKRERGRGKEEGRRKRRGRKGRGGGRRGREEEEGSREREGRRKKGGRRRGGGRRKEGEGGEEEDRRREREGRRKRGGRGGEEEEERRELSCIFTFEVCKRSLERYSSQVTIDAWQYIHGSPRTHTSTAQLNYNAVFHMCFSKSTTFPTSLLNIRTNIRTCYILYVYCKWVVSIYTLVTKM